MSETIKCALLMAAVSGAGGPALAARPILAVADDGTTVVASAEEAARISLDVVDASLQDVISQIMGDVGVEIVITKGVQTVRVTARLEDVPWDTALRWILEEEGLVLRQRAGGSAWVIAPAP